MATGLTVWSSCLCISWASTGQWTSRMSLRYSEGVECVEGGSVKGEESGEEG